MSAFSGAIQLSIVVGSVLSSLLGSWSILHVVVSLGGDVRICPDLGFSGEGGHIDAYGVYFTDAGQHQEHRPYVAHTEPHCYFRVTYKGALLGEGAHAV